MCEANNHRRTGNWNIYCLLKYFEYHIVQPIPIPFNNNRIEIFTHRLKADFLNLLTSKTQNTYGDLFTKFPYLVILFNGNNTI